MDPKKLKKKILAVMEKMKSISEVIKTKEDKEEIELLQKEFDAQKTECDTLQKSLEEALVEVKAKIKLDALLKDADDVTSADVEDKALAGKRQPAEAKDAAQELVDHQKAFFKFMTAKKDQPLGISEGEYDHFLRVKSKSFKEGESGVVAPREIADNVFGEKFADVMGHKALPMVSSSNQQGGYLIQAELQKRIDTVPTEQPHILPRATIYPVKSGSLLIPKLVQTDANEYGAMAAAWTSEGAEKNETEVAFDQEEIDCHELSAWTQLSHRLIARTPMDLVRFISNLAKDCLNGTLDTAFISGSGTGQPLGIINTTGIRTVARAVAGSVGYADLVGLKHEVLPQHRTSAEFMTNDDVLEALELTVDSNNKPLFNSSTGTGIHDRLVGKPYVATVRQPTLGSDGDIAFGSFKEYIVGMEEQIVVRRSDDYDFVKNVGTFAFYLVVGGLLVQPRTWAILEETAS